MEKHQVLVAKTLAEQEPCVLCKAWQSPVCILKIPLIDVGAQALFPISYSVTGGSFRSWAMDAIKELYNFGFEERLPQEESKLNIAKAKHVAQKYC